MPNLFHYCSNTSFHSIVVQKAIQLCSLSLSNDSMEGKLVAEITSRIAKDDGLDASAIQRLQESVEGLEKVFDGLGFCLSEDGDLLSQWRGYAADATGVSIGFSKSSLNKLSEASRDPKKPGFTLQRVEYEQSAQVNLVKPTYVKIKEAIDKGAFKIPGPRGLLDIRSEKEIEEENKEINRIYKEFVITVSLLFKDLFLLKTKAFKEEREWRLVSYFIKSGDKCMFRAMRDRIIPYREFSLELSEGGVIREVILGPKNVTPAYVIESFLNSHGFTNVKISHSDASYR